MVTLPFDRFPVLRSQDADKVRAAIWAYVGKHPIEFADAESGLDARINGRMIERVSGSYLAFGTETSTGPGELGVYLVQIVVSGRYWIGLGDQEVEAGPGDVVVLSPDLDVRTRWSAKCGVVAYAMRAEHVMSHLSGLLGRPVNRTLTFDLALAGPGRSLDHGLLRPLTHQLNRDGGVLADPANARRVEDTLLTGLLRSQPNTYSDVLEQEFGWPEQ